MREHAWQHDKYLNHPITWPRGPCFLVAWNIHVSCNSSCATCGIVTRGIITRAVVTREIIKAWNNHAWNRPCTARDSLEWNTCRHKRAVNIRYSSAINLQKHVEFSPQL